MQQPTSLREAQEERTVAQQERGGAIEWQRRQCRQEVAIQQPQTHGLGGIYCLILVYHNMQVHA